jgi:ABC-type nitrate/sulfonate/bicarbonate transport system substrate-binding protein
VKQQAPTWRFTSCSITRLRDNYSGRIWRRLVVAPACIAIASALVACGSSASSSTQAKEDTSATLSQSVIKLANSATPLKLRIGFTSDGSIYWGFFGAEALGDFQKLHLDTTADYLDEATCIKALASGSLDVCAVSLATIMQAAAEGVTSVRVIGTLAHVDTDAISVNPKIVKSFADLAGKAIAANNAANESNIEAHAMLALHGLKTSDVSFIAVGSSSDRYAALKAGKTPAAITAPPLSYIAADAGYPTLAVVPVQASVAIYLAAIPNRSTTTDAALVRLLEGIQSADKWIDTPANQTAAVATWKKIFPDFAGSSAQYAARTLTLDAYTLKSFTAGVQIEQSEVTRDASISSTYADIPEPSSLENLVYAPYASFVISHG